MWVVTMSLISYPKWLHCIYSGTCCISSYFKPTKCNKCYYKYSKAIWILRDLWNVLMRYILQYRDICTLNYIMIFIHWLSPLVLGVKVVITYTFMEWKKPYHAKNLEMQLSITLSFNIQYPYLLSSDLVLATVFTWPTIDCCLFSDIPLGAYLCRALQSICNRPSHWK